MRKKTVLLRRKNYDGIFNLYSAIRQPYCSAPKSFWI